jgi:hypothetical protein
MNFGNLATGFSVNTPFLSDPQRIISYEIVRCSTWQHRI